MYLLKLFWCYLEVAEFEVITDNQVLNKFLSKPDLSSREARWLEFLSQFWITRLILEKGCVHVLGDVLSRAAHASEANKMEVNNIHTMSIRLADNYPQLIENDQTFGPLWRALKGSLPNEKVQLDRVTRLIEPFQV